MELIWHIYVGCVGFGFRLGLLITAAEEKQHRDMLIYQSAMPHRLEKSGKILTDVTRLGIPIGLMNCTMVL